MFEIIREQLAPENGTKQMTSILVREEFMFIWTRSSPNVSENISYKYSNSAGSRVTSDLAGKFRVTPECPETCKVTQFRHTPEYETIMPTCKMILRGSEREHTTHNTSETPHADSRISISLTANGGFSFAKREISLPGKLFKLFRPQYPHIAPNEARQSTD